MGVFEERKIDCHAHVLDPVRFPYAADVAYRPVGQEIGTADQFVQVLRTYGVEHALLVQPDSGYGGDNRCLLAGGAGTAIAFELALGGVAALVILEVDLMRQRALIDELRRSYPGLAVHDRVLEGLRIDVAVDASPAGMSDGDPLPYPSRCIDCGRCGHQAGHDAMVEACRAAGHRYPDRRRDGGSPAADPAHRSALDGCRRRAGERGQPHRSGMRFCEASLLRVSARSVHVADQRSAIHPRW